MTAWEHLLLPERWNGMCPGLCGQCRDVLCRDTGTYQTASSTLSPWPLHRRENLLTSGALAPARCEDGTRPMLRTVSSAGQGVGATSKARAYTPPRCPALPPPPQMGRMAPASSAPPGSAHRFAVDELTIHKAIGQAVQLAFAEHELVGKQSCYQRSLVVGQ